jgi:hypothetical protein
VLNAAVESEHKVQPALVALVVENEACAGNACSALGMNVEMGDGVPEIAAELSTVADRWRDFNNGNLSWFQSIIELSWVSTRRIIRVEHERTTFGALAILGMNVQTRFAMTKAAGSVTIKSEPGFRSVGVKNELNTTFGSSTFGVDK